MTELAVPESNQPAIPANRAPQAAPQQPMPSELMLWVEEARQASIVALSLSKTSFAGALRGKPDEITAAILAGQELGMKPMTTLKAIDIIQGTPALRAHAMRGLVQSKGHEIELVDSSDTHCIMRGRRKGSDHWQEVEWPIERARQLGLLGKDQWKKQPKTMLIARATGELCRLIASDVLHGMPYAAEELGGDTVTVAGTEFATRAPRLSVAALTAAPQAAPSQAAPTQIAEAAPETDEPWEQDTGSQQYADDEPAGGWPETAQIPN